MANFQGTADSPSSRLIDTCKSYLNNWIDVLRTRVEIIATEIQEESERLRSILLFALASAFCLSVGMILLTLFIVTLFWEQRVIVLGTLTLLYLAAGFAAAAVTRNKMRSKPKIFSATIAELRKDQERLSR